MCFYTYILMCRSFEFENGFRTHTWRCINIHRYVFVHRCIYMRVNMCVYIYMCMYIHHDIRGAHEHDALVQAPMPCLLLWYGFSVFMSLGAVIQKSHHRSVGWPVCLSVCPSVAVSFVYIVRTWVCPCSQSAVHSEDLSTS